jgi:hypothetical protein
MKPRTHGCDGIDSHAVPSLATGHTEILNVIALLADSLQALESSTIGVDANQYDLLISQLKAEMGRIEMNREYRTLLSRYPAAAELYENLHYETNGLCMHNNEHAILAERIARGVIQACARDTI